ncbi:hypothetical protein A2U01_0046490, partial [Trifolium medium]|nr:hypothetical protein [Trifolium medium]
MDKLCRNSVLNIENLAPLGPWIRSNHYGRRRLDPRDRQFYSNPSISPNFGTYSPPVPTALIEQLAAMKIKTQGFSTQTQPQGSETNTANVTTNDHQGDKGNQLVVSSMGSGQGASSSRPTTQIQLT